ncbi:hypothetical protein BD410DRAFT_812755 [Rickenella mellea]|uniref:BBC1/AIM3 cysteine proteinase-fold domain-containing protein n=1 Tax=Rickenella mellea TaxID=50990 RepID=A0A4Y7QIT1_9AGAM|nr:hypothetical protein BD410DRAFT_812755 [Rickenella mellea]
MAQSKFITEDGRAPPAKSPPPPPPPLRSSHPSASSNSSLSTPKSPAFARSPPPIARASKPGVPSRTSDDIPTHAEEYHDETPDIDRIDWANLSPADKQMFFSWLDEFFSRFLGSPISSRSPNATGKNFQRSITDNTSRNPPPSRVSSSPQTKAPSVNIPTRGPPPPVASWSRPDLPTESNDNDFELSHPPSSTYGCSALDLAYYFHLDTPWDSAWYAGQPPLPPSLQGNTDIRWVGMFQTSAKEKTMYSGVLFADLSICWFRVDYPSSATERSNPAEAQRHAEYLPRPQPWPKERLIEAHETYGETIAAFAEGYVGSGEFCGRGECWDLANESLKYFEAYDYVPTPIVSISRTHGHLIFEGKAVGKGKQVGRWRGGDDRVRRGDIVEWRKVKINIVGAPRGSYALLGSPDHTAIITRDSEPTRIPVDGESLLPSELVQLEVVEQSVNSPPDKKTYDLAALEDGEMWIYRPVGMLEYLGVTLEAKPPGGVETLGIN